ncbi:hypothetical protein Ocin01_01250 [Orchesella cincta]|uniref:CHHC U11-48K-type domain-containing protein n=1 Tax=Orchesella cincta TaxID=48709 RepID=A0A1D2NJK7_ORCCI|nr:hypothetical protein Ocin01_01250 [Orchesella cincta]
MTTEFILAPGEEFVQCPYNLSHTITNAKILIHLDKCRRSYLNGLSESAQKRAMRICRHNATHHIPYPEMKFHEERCKDAFSVVKYLAYHNSEEGNRDYEKEKTLRQEKESIKLEHQCSSGRAETKPNVSNAWDLEEEDWEAEDTGYKAGYDPKEKLKNEVVLYVPAGLTKSERKKFRLEVREKTAESSMTGEKLELPTALRYEHKPDLTALHIADTVKKEETPQEVEKVETISPQDYEDSRRQRRDNESGSSSRNRDRDRDRRSPDGDSDRNYTRSSDRDRDRNYPRSSDRDRERNYPRSSDRDRDRDYRRSSDKDRNGYQSGSSRREDKSYSESSRKDYDRGDYNERSHSPDGDAYYARQSGNDNIRSEAPRSQSPPPSTSRGSHYDSADETEVDMTFASRREKAEYIDDDFLGFDPFTKDDVQTVQD